MPSPHPDIHAIHEDALRKASAGVHGIPSSDLRQYISEKYGLSPREGQRIIRDLVAEGVLSYSYRFGTSLLEKSFQGPVRVSRRVVLAPPGASHHPAPGEVVIRLASGAAFGSGRHPSSRLAVRGIEYALTHEIPDVVHDESSDLLDIGVGSGILALAGVMLGIHKGVGVDTDPCARSEARENVRLNHLEDRVQIDDRTLDAFDAPFRMIVANLRRPTIVELFPRIDRLTQNGGVVVLSGLKEEEIAGLEELYENRSFVRKWRDVQQGWASMVLVKRMGCGA
ncbi:MAG: hypothetical protein GY859_20740 [Desulfobacterales bacterium]|nr:hypothetical protein [Desulfobacterales bacterium]